MIPGNSNNKTESKLRLCFVINEDLFIPAWENEMLQQLIKEQLIQNVTFLCVPLTATTKESLAYRLFRKFEHRWFRSIPDAFKPAHVKHQYQDASFLLAADNPVPIGDICYISCLINNYKPGKEPFYGTWFVEFGTGNYRNAKPPAFWEVMNDDPVTGSSLLTSFPETNNTVTVYNGVTTSVPYSVKNNLNSIAWKSASYLAYRLKELLLIGNDAFIKKYQKLNSIEISGAAKYSKSPGNLKMVWLFLSNTFRYIVYKLKKISTHPRFTLLYSFETYNGNNIDLHSFKAMPLPKNIFRADPFIITKDKEHYIFFEEYLYQKQKAHISLIKTDSNGNFSKPVMVLEKEHHLAYPFVFEWNGVYYMIPETSTNKTVALYKATRFPDKWEFVMNLMEDIVLIDVTLLYENNTWWLFGNSTNNNFTSTNDQLFLFYSKDLLSQQWVPHPQNPIVTDISNCRPGGKFFRINNQLFRPAQHNASKQYGYALCINKIITLNETEYLEEKVSELLPDKTNGLSAIHTFNFTDGLIIIDGIVRK